MPASGPLPKRLCPAWHLVNIWMGYCTRKFLYWRNEFTWLRFCWNLYSTHMSISLYSSNQNKLWTSTFSTFTYKVCITYCCKQTILSTTCRILTLGECALSGIQKWWKSHHIDGSVNWECLFWDFYDWTLSESRIKLKI